MDPVLVQVARQKNVGTQTIVQILADRGITIDNRPNFPMTREMIRHIDEWLAEQDNQSGEAE